MCVPKNLRQQATGNTPLHKTINNMANQIIQKFNIAAGNKATVFALNSAAQIMVCSDAEPYVSQSSIAHASRPKDVPLATVNYGKLVSSPMGNHISVVIRLPKDLASKLEFIHQIELLYNQAVAGHAAGIVNPQNV